MSGCPKRDSRSSARNRSGCNCPIRRQGPGTWRSYPGRPTALSAASSCGACVVGQSPRYVGFGGGEASCQPTPEAIPGLGHCASLARLRGFARRIARARRDQNLIKPENPNVPRACARREGSSRCGEEIQPGAEEGIIRASPTAPRRERIGVVPVSGDCVAPRAPELGEIFFRSRSLAHLWQRLHWRRCGLHGAKHHGARELGPEPPQPKPSIRRGLLCFWRRHAIVPPELGDTAAPPVPCCRAVVGFMAVADGATEPAPPAPGGFLVSDVDEPLALLSWVILATPAPAARSLESAWLRVARLVSLAATVHRAPIPAHHVSALMM